MSGDRHRRRRGNLDDWPARRGAAPPDRQGDTFFDVDGTMVEANFTPPSSPGSSDPAAALALQTYWAALVAIALAPQVFPGERKLVGLAQDALRAVRDLREGDGA